MKMTYYPDMDALSIVLAGGPAPYGEDTQRDNITMFFDENDQLIEILIDQASEAAPLDKLKGSPHFEICAPEAERA